MAFHTTDPKDFARRVNENMLAEFLSIQDPPISFNLTGEKPTKRKRVSDDVVERFIYTIESLENPQKAAWLLNELRYIGDLASDWHIASLETKATEKGIVYDVVGYNKCENNAERALWWYFHYKNIFDAYYEKADTEDFAGLRERIIKDEYIVDKEKIIDERKLATFGEGVANIFATALSGRKFKVSYFMESECVLLRVYLQNLPENQLVFAEGDEPQPDVIRTPSTRSLFSIVIVYSTKEKILGIRTNKPAENVPKLGDLFCKTFLNCTYDDTIERKYNVENQGSVERLELTLDPMNDIERCYLKAVEYAKQGDVSKILRLDVGGRHNYNGTLAMQELIGFTFRKDDGSDGEIRAGDWRPKKFEIKFIFRKDDEMKGRKRQRITTLTQRGANTKSTPEDIKIRQFLKEKGFIS